MSESDSETLFNFVKSEFLRMKEQGQVEGDLFDEKLTEFFETYYGLYGKLLFFVSSSGRFVVFLIKGKKNVYFVAGYFPYDFKNNFHNVSHKILSMFLVQERLIPLSNNSGKEIVSVVVTFLVACEALVKEVVRCVDLLFGSNDLGKPDIWDLYYHRFEGFVLSFAYIKGSFAAYIYPRFRIFKTRKNDVLDWGISVSYDARLNVVYSVDFWYQSLDDFCGLVKTLCVTDFG